MLTSRHEAEIWRAVGSTMVLDSELEHFKNGIDLRVYAASRGYMIDKRESGRSSSVMRDPTGDKIIVKRDTDGHYVYFSVRDDRDHGTIIDFVRHRLGLSLGSVRKELRPWIGALPADLPVFPLLAKVAKDWLQVYREFARMLDAPQHPYLENERGIPAALLASERFLGKIKIDARGNAVFPHFDAEGLSGYESKNKGFTSFSPGGTKALWISNKRADDDCMVFCESAIDALSHAVLFPADHARYASIGGNTNPQQPELIRAAAARMPVGSVIAAAMDADKDGRKLAEVVRRAVEMSGRSDLRFELHEPESFKDWNDQLRSRPQHPLPYRRERPSVA
jgi:hypothetical protein